MRRCQLHTIKARVEVCVLILEQILNICVSILLYVCPHTTICVSSEVCVRILQLYIRMHQVCASACYTVRPHTTVYIVHMYASGMCPHTAIYAIYDI